MKRFILLFFTIGLCQSSKAQLIDFFPVYFENDIAEITPSNQQFLINKFKSIDTTKIESISFIAYNDNTGTEQYNIDLSKKRSQNILDLLKKNQLNFEVTSVINGIIKTEIKDFYTKEYITHLRNRDRRIDVTINYRGKPSFIDLQKNKITTKLNANLNLGDRVYLDNIVFPIDRSVITKEISEILNQIALQLNKYKNVQIEIQGHICCTRGKDAIDIDTGKLELSSNRAKAVYNYLIKKGVDSKRLRYKGYGNKKPLGFDADLDKRVEFYVTKS